MTRSKGVSGSKVGGESLPFLKVLIPAVVGIFVGWHIDVAWWVWASCLCLSLVAAIVWRRENSGNLYLWMAIMLFFTMLTDINRPHTELPFGNRIEVVAKIMETPHQRGRWQSATTKIGAYRLSPFSGKKGGWHEVDEKIILMIDSSYRELRVGARIEYTAWVNAIDTTGSGYGNLMRARGIHGRMYLTPGAVDSVSYNTSKSLRYYATVMQNWAIERLERLSMPAQAESVVVAMVAGDQRAIDRTVRQEYSRTGAAHILSVSGFHVGVVFILINILLYLLPLFRYGHVVKNIVAIVAIWLYATMTGLDPPVIRSALMGTFAQLALATNSQRDGLNIVLASAVLMLAVNPNYAVDISFLLSYVAVLGIILFVVPIYGVLRSRNKLVNAFIVMMLIGVVASAVTAPLVSHWFGAIPIVGVVLNPVIVLTGNVIVMVGVLWVIAPFGFMSGAVGWLLKLMTTIQNTIVEWGSGFSWGAVEVRMDMWAVLIIYGMMIWLAMELSRWVGKRENREKI